MADEILKENEGTAAEASASAEDSASSEKPYKREFDGREPEEQSREGGERSGGYRGRGLGSKSFFVKKKVCRFCTQKLKIDYKEPDVLRRFITDRGKILARRITGTCSKHQRAVAEAIKRARAIALLPYVSE